jgi:hypothetical protein
MDTMQDQPLRNGRSWFGMTEEQLEEIVYQVRKKAD